MATLSKASRSPNLRASVDVLFARQREFITTHGRFNLVLIASFTTMRYALLTSALVLFSIAARAQTLVEHSSEARFQIDLKVPDSALKSFLPQGWTPNVAAQG